ncbi:cobalt-precorrin-4 C(11)-methyltransferase [Thermosipho melanesiensis]|uniref:Precorrin-4 C11-methyltransferase n=2 Tax=Thermosipho melanesiensis TaxID=46541 RepID=A6LKW5_THEM4|nr:precorrin-4 C(11)-methyltransferase [Thermosipho melanesiensis]ABR30566.1 precorrin-4 C11-methyltransferase [Thermosipho melanesiensis BI429]APT73714.1 cobalt-precorrin-4 C(11)-methyltransferase [Thermosipho melanesiensis]OOC35652.1 cobalt-precorrin-4 C(11)-methyltransferase [Thermosipho melanesiensis]OOC38951.1 cobalt-precorrin-4 C(11)-methyltransferase [Thermosipho melanesiensis]OOC39099.1 cobalt-precorrin-4 C(11)-methyltransferase [Thermosipho melanesiensis]
MVYFIGAGPGDPELITLKAYKILQKCDVVIYAGSLVNKEILNFTKKDAKIFDSSKLTLEEIIDIYKKYKEKDIARLHTGDPSIYGAINEQIYFLEEMNIPYEIIPGVSSAFAAAAKIKSELTAPDISQTVIFTRYGKNIPTPENIKELAKHKSTLIIFLSVNYLSEIVETLKTEYPIDTPVKVVYKATWKDEKIIHGTLENITEKAKEIKNTALIFVGEVFKKKDTFSKLYDKNFSHKFRKVKP